MRVNMKAGEVLVIKTSQRYVSAWLLNAVLTYAASLHIDRDTLLRSAGIEPDEVKDGGKKIDMERFCAVCAALTDASGGALSGFRLAEGVGRLYSGSHILLSIMCCCPTLGDALLKLARYHDIASDALRLKLINDGTKDALVLTPAGLPPLLANIFLEAAAACTAMVKSLTADAAYITEIHLMLPARGEAAAYEEFFGCPVTFGCEKTEIIFRSGALNAPLALSDPALLDMLEGYARSKLVGATDGSMSEKLRNYMDSMISQGKTFHIGDTAEQLGVGVRTLQKRLKNESVTYSALLEEVKKVIAVKSLEDTDASLLDTAFLLGFSEQSAFNRAFKKWTGVSPMKYRQKRPR
jgi:AraC-like DNA-binding protein